MSRIPADYQLCLRFRDGDEWAFEELLRRHRDMIFHQANQFGAPGEARDDIEQAARIGMLKAARGFRPDRGCSFRYFAQLAVRAEVITTVVKARRDKHGVLNESLSLAYPVRLAHEETVELESLITGPHSDDPLEILLAREEFNDRVAALRRCSPLERTVITRRLNGEDYAQAGRGLGGKKPVDNALQRVRKKLRAAA
jgi:RNA polymerase sigma-H factor